LQELIERGDALLAAKFCALFRAAFNSEDAEARARSHGFWASFADLYAIPINRF